MMDALVYGDFVRATAALRALAEEMERLGRMPRCRELTQTANKFDQWLEANRPSQGQAIAIRVLSPLR